MRRRVATFFSAATRDDVCTGDKRASGGDDYNHRMLALRYVYVLALVVWLGGMLMLGATLPRFHYIAYGAGALMLLTLGAMRVLGPRPAHGGLRAIIVAVMLGV